jgi:pimeloyl-ACP methyl ester carboxylesterase
MSPTRSPIPGIDLVTLRANGLQVRAATAGQGPFILLAHGWPEGWYSWRHQILALARAGYRVVAPDMRGYGGTDAPADIERYTLLDLAADMIALVGALDEREAVIVGHDWGAPVAWHAALFRPDLFRAVVGMSVPWAPPGKVDLIASLEKAQIHDFYMQYFQPPGVAEAELERDIRRSLRMTYFTASGDQREKGKGFTRLIDGTFLGNCVDPPVLPDWLTESDLDHMTAEFTRTGFRGGLNWYRNLTRNWRLTQAWRHRPIPQPALFIAGSRDGVLRFPASKAQIEAYPQTLPGCRGVHVLDGAGHWVQQERADAVSDLLIGFLRGLD